MSNLPPNWKRGQIAELLSKQFAGEWGQSPSSAQGNAYVLRATDLDKNGHLNYETAANRQISSPILNQKKLRLGDIILEAAGGGPGTPVGHVGFFNASASQSYVASNFFRTLRPHPAVSPKFLWWRLSLMVSEPCIWRYQQQTTGIINLRVVDYLKHSLVIPENKNEQAAIAAILDTLDDVTLQTAAVIEKLKKIKAGLLHDLLTRGIDESGQLRDPVRHPEQFKDSPLGKVPKAWDICSLMQYVAFPTGQVDPRLMPYNQWPLIAPDHIESGTGRLLYTVSAKEQNAISGKYGTSRESVGDS